MEIEYAIQITTIIRRTCYVPALTRGIGVAGYSLLGITTAEERLCW